MADAQPLPFVSRVPGIKIAAAHALPSNPSTEPVDDFCSSYVIEELKTKGARLINEHGWHVTSEDQIGQHVAIGFVGEFEPGTSGVCFAKNGNLAIFKGSTLEAIAFNPDGADVALAQAERIGPDRLRLKASDPQPPLADMIFGDQVIVQPLPKVERVCKGSVAIPNIFGQVIDKAGSKLAQAGWKRDPDADECSGTGYGFCAYEFHHANGAVATVTTLGPAGNVIDYDVSCET